MPLTVAFHIGAPYAGGPWPVDHDGRHFASREDIGMGMLDGKAAFVTGGGSGIGAATCRRFAAEGARVAVVDINGDSAKAVASEIDGIAYAVDVTDYDAVADAARDADAQLGGLTTVFNNAGGSNLSPTHDYDVAEWTRIVTLNLSGVFHGFKAT